MHATWLLSRDNREIARKKKSVLAFLFELGLLTDYNNMLGVFQVLDRADLT